MILSEAATRRWQPCSGNVCASSSWNGCNFPCGCHIALFGTCPAATCINVNLGTGTTTIGLIRVQEDTCNGTVGVYNFTNSGTLQTASCGDHIQFRSGTVNISGGGTIRARGNSDINMGQGLCNQTVNVNLSNASTLEANWSNCGSTMCIANQAGACVTVTVVGGSTLRSGSNLNIGANATATANVTVSCSTIAANNAGQIQVGLSGTATLTLTNSCVTAHKLNVGMNCGATGHLRASCSTINLTNDFDIGDAAGASGYATLTNITACIGADFIIGQFNGGAGTTYISGGCYTVAAGLVLADQCGAGGSGHLVVSGGANITQNDNSCQTGQRRSALGVPCNNNYVLLDVQGGSTITYNDTQGVKFGCESIVQLSGGSVIKSDNACSGTFCFGGCGTIIRGCGTIENDIQFVRDCAVFSAACGETLTLSGHISQNGGGSAAYDIVFNGAGSLRLGTDDMIDNSDTDLDIDINGGTLDLNGTTQGADNATIGNLTLSAGSTLEFTSGDASQNLFLRDVSWAGTINITDWDGTPGASGTGGRILVDAASSSLTLGDNGGSGFSGISWNGGTYTLFEVLSVDINGTTFHEIVPFGAVPEPSTWVATLGIVFVSLYHLRRRRRVSDT